MTTKEYLSQIKRYDKMIANKREEITNLRSMACGTSIQISGDRVQRSGNKDKLGSFMSEIVDMEQELKEMLSKRCLIVREIESLENGDEYDVLAKRYILRKNVKEIAIENGKTERQILSVTSKALGNFEKKYGCKYLELE